jgi:prepilin-type N-terminal cleavage/methylation domain-containing protein
MKTQLIKLDCGNLSFVYRRNSIDYRLHRNGKSCNGFTLVELSIVLLVIGLITSGVLVGKDMIRAAELRSITTQKDQVETSVMLFKNKYLGLPGDLNNATAFWGTMPTGTCSNTFVGASGGTGTQTCNGNGDGNLQFSVGVAWNSNPEFSLFWQHLSNAGLIEGVYNGRFISPSGTPTNGLLGKIDNTRWSPEFYGNRL